MDIGDGVHKKPTKSTIYSKLVLLYYLLVQHQCQTQLAYVINKYQENLFIGSQHGLHVRSELRQPKILDPLILISRHRKKGRQRPEERRKNNTSTCQLLELRRARAIKINFYQVLIRLAYDRLANNNNNNNNSCCSWSFFCVLQLLFCGSIFFLLLLYCVIIIVLLLFFYLLILIISTIIIL